MSSLLLSRSDRRILADWLSSHHINGDRPRRPADVDPGTWRAILNAELADVPLGVLGSISDFYGTGWMDRLRYPATRAEILDIR